LVGPPVHAAEQLPKKPLDQIPPGDTPVIPADKPTTPPAKKEAEKKD
jgi:hypothetical protein